MKTALLILLGLALVGLAGWVILRRVRSEAKSEARAEITASAAEERLEMDREATDIERKVVKMTDEEARKEALRWSKRP